MSENDGLICFFLVIAATIFGNIINATMSISGSIHFTFINFFASLFFIMAWISASFIGGKKNSKGYLIVFTIYFSTLLVLSVMINSSYGTLNIFLLLAIIFTFPIDFFVEGFNILEPRIDILICVILMGVINYSTFYLSRHLNKKKICESGYIMKQK